MTADFVGKRLVEVFKDFDLVVLKGFESKLILELGELYELLDKDIFKGGKIDLSLVNAKKLLMSILAIDSSKKSLCTCESLIDLSSQVNNLSFLGKRICVLENNMLSLYPNPTNTEMPDFDSENFHDIENPNALYSGFYSFCIREENEEWVQYINNYSTGQDIVVKLLIDPTVEKIKIGTTTDIRDISILSAKDGSLHNIMSKLYNSMSLDKIEYAIEQEEIDEKEIRTLISASKLMGQPLVLYKITRELNIEPRKELYSLLKKIWGYESFRDLKIYKNLFIDKEVINISQGAIIETVIRQVEFSIQDSSKLSNILLTSPTGAGKSLLFQLSALYIADKYGFLTIVISPLVALMNDQVQGIGNYSGAAALNSNKTASEKHNILDGIKNGEINLLYLSPELLLSYSITSFIGNRRLGMIVVDEAHTVTTWGRDFRVDYWFLGDYIRKAKRVLNYAFPIFALTATAVWNPKGDNDMVFDTIRSLNMDPCIKFIGVVRRENIRFEIELSNINKNYEERRNKLTIERIREALSLGRKTIVYFPFRRTVDSVFFSDETTDIRDRLARYHASLLPEEKTVNAKGFKEGTLPIMCATKAFGMGIDVSDISEVYHHAPTGCLSDYVQEIGRLARNPQIIGTAKIDFSEKDFRYIRKLHGLSAIKPYQLKQVLKKLMAIYRLNGEKRNLLISASDFSYIFPKSTPEEVDQNLKSCLLLISNDLLNKLRFHALIVRPKSLFSKAYVEVREDQAKDFFRLFCKYLVKVNNSIFILDADKLWSDKFNNISFPQFKYKLAEGKIFKDFDVKVRNKISLLLHSSVKGILTEIEQFFFYSHKFLDEMSRTHHRIAFKEMKAKLPVSFDGAKREQFVETFRMLYASNNNLGSGTAAYCSVFSFNEGDANTEDYFQLMQSGYETISHLYLDAYRNLITSENQTCFCDSKDRIVYLSEFLNSLGVADYQRVGGQEPSIFVRINNPYTLNSLVRKGDYDNEILNSIYAKYHFSEKIFSYFFTQNMTDKQRWDFIEAYFLGATEEELLNFV